MSLSSETTSPAPYITVRYVKPLPSSLCSGSFSQQDNQQVIEAKFPLIEIKPHRIPSSFKKLRTESAHSLQPNRARTTTNVSDSMEGNIATNNTVNEESLEKSSILNALKYKVDIKAIADFFDLEEDCILQQDCGRMCMLMDQTVIPFASYIVSGTMRSQTMSDDDSFEQSASQIQTPLKRTGIVFDRRMQSHVGRASHPESPARLSAIWSSCIEDNNFDKLCTIMEGRKATREELEWTHSPHHVDAVMASRLDMFNHTTDVFVTEESGNAARLACGGLMDLSQKVLMGELDNGFAVIRPPGHHCYSDKASGFCLLNNVAVAANAALKRGLAKRVVIVDWDVHHGNGTQAIFEEQFRSTFLDVSEETIMETPEVLFFSLHQTRNNFYPNTGNLEQLSYDGAKRFIVNIPFDEVYGDQELLNAFEQIVIPLAKSYNPDLVLVSAGFDAVKGDKLGGQLCSPQVYGHLTALLMELAKGKVVCALEGGYNIEETASCVKECISVLLGKEPSVLSYLLEPPYLKEEQIQKHAEMLQRVKTFYSELFNKSVK
ncbi:hypothetical protein FDP41_005264 [Naegleria fowleri]|uniref:histone deacetylase n=1 Tax=Naegleria fowleri TaxID=5763 RepID=A0A6A5BG25_NAEFO|nr:uncharacterized protein FDP41_005264 [Naegleria fowleri]KAF0975937.1 hypothetical protein FDP41_005264 [Naegleria fowleri]